MGREGLTVGGRGKQKSNQRKVLAYKLPGDINYDGEDWDANEDAESSKHGYRQRGDCRQRRSKRQ
jgi:hypothetical protein